jgi:PAS domain S-box-containing protein
MNPAGLAMVGASNADRVIGKNVLDLVLPAYHDAFKQSIKDVFNGKSVKLDFEIRGFKGKKLFMETHCVPLKNAAGDIISLLSVTRDITESKNAQALLLASEEQYKDLFNNNPSCIFIWDLDTLKYIEVNQASVDLYGYSRKEFLQLTVLDIRPAAECAGFLKVVNEIRQDETYNKTNTWRHISKEGKSLFMEISSHIIMYNGTKAMLAIANNVTEKIKLENSLNSEREIRHQQITEAVITGQEKERTELGEELHDNINQILASTKLYIECALKDNKPRKDLIEESKLLLEKAMTEIRNLSKSLLPPSLGEIGLLQALQEMVDNIKQVNQLLISIEWNDTNEDEICSKLKLTIFRIVQEQLNNVIKHAEAQKVIISIKKAEQQLIVSIQDNGLGFNTSLKKNGVGLRNISSRAGVNNGSVAIISQPGEGCELVVTFRLHNEEEHQVVDI